MQWVIVQAMLTFAVSAGLAVFVGLQRPRTRSHDLVLALLVSFMLWTAGVIFIHGAETQATRRIATTMVFTGVVFVSPIWLYLCAYLAHARVVLDHPRASLASLLTPGVAMVCLVATDGSHGLFASGETRAIFHTPVAVWAGPAFWAHSVWSYVCTFGGISVALATARRAANPIERKRLLLVATAAAIPVFTTVVLPGAVPFILTGVRQAVSLGLIGVVVGEMFGGSEGIGYMVNYGGQTFQTDTVFLGVTIIALSGIILTWLAERLERRFSRWRPER